METKQTTDLFERFLSAGSLTLKEASSRIPFPKAGDRAAWEALPDGTKQSVIRWGEQALAGYPARPASGFLAYTRTGDRQADEKPYFARRHLLIAAALAECAEYRGRFLDAVIDGIWLICEESSWVISAHNGSSHAGSRPPRERPLPDPDNPYIDLFAAQTAATVGYVVYLLEDELNAVAPLIVRRARQEVMRRVILPFFHHDDFWWMGFIRRDLNNWTPWILSNVIDSMLLCLGDELRLKEGLTRAMRMLDSYLATLPADGGLDEGTSYWNVAGASLLDCLESLRRAVGLDLYHDPLIRAVGSYPLNAHIAGDWFWNFADCDAKPTLDGERLYTYGLRTDNAGLQELGAALYHRRDLFPPRDTPQMNRLLLALLTQVPKSSGRVPEERNIQLPALQAYAFERGALYAAIKGGHNAESHNHNDVGSFLLYHRGEPAVVDAGNMIYTAKTFSPQRYELWNTRSGNHNLPIIAGMEQRAGREAQAQDLRLSGNGVSMELRAAYPEKAGIQSFRRELVNDGSVRLIDSIRLDAPEPVTWVFLSRTEPQLMEPGQLCIGDLVMRYDPALSFALEEHPVEDARMARSFPGSLWRISMSADPALSHEQRFELREKP